MKNKLLFLNVLFIFTLFWCSIDEQIEGKDNNSVDYDDVNIISKIWEQSIDKAIKIVNTRTKAS